MSSTTDAINPAAAVEPFWQRIHRFFTLPLDRAVAKRIAGLAVAGVIAFALFFLGALGVLAGLAGIFGVLVVGARYGFKIIERSSRGFLQPGDYPLSDEDLVSPYLPYKFVAMNFVFGLVLGLYLLFFPVVPATIIPATADSRATMPAGLPPRGTVTLAMYDRMIAAGVLPSPKIGKK